MPAQARDDWIDHVLHVMGRRGIRAGAARVAVIEVLGRRNGCLTADEIADELRSRGQAVGLASVYRALHVLAGEGLLRAASVPSRPVRYDLVRPGGEHHHHLVCAICGRTDAFSDDRLERAIEALSDELAFEVATHEITLHGTCERCRSPKR